MKKSFIIKIMPKKIKLRSNLCTEFGPPVSTAD